MQFWRLLPNFIANLIGEVGNTDARTEIFLNTLPFFYISYSVSNSVNILLQASWLS